MIAGLLDTKRLDRMDRGGNQRRSNCGDPHWRHEEHDRHNIHRRVIWRDAIKLIAQKARDGQSPACAVGDSNQAGQ